MTGGCRNTKIGKIPADWDVVSLGEISDPKAPIRYGVVQIGPNAENGVPIVPIKHINRIDTASLPRASRLIESRYSRSRVQGGDVLISVKGTVGRVGVVPDGFRGNIAREIARIRLLKIANPHFIALQLKSQHVQRRIADAIVGSTRLEFSIADVRKFLVALPRNIFEQHRIAEIFQIWEKAHSTSSRLHQAKEQALCSVREALTAGHARGQANAWPIAKLGDVTNHLTARNNGRLDRNSVMGVTKADGVVPMREHVMATDLSRYLVLPPQAFAYNPMRINIGSIAMSEAEEDVLVSPDYVVFTCDTSKLLPRYLNHLRKAARWARFMDIAGNGSVRIRIYYADLADFEFHLPPLAEQARIVAILDDAEREIALLHAEREAREAQRDALATKLLTGEWRVAV